MVLLLLLVLFSFFFLGGLLGPRNGGYFFMYRYLYIVPGTLPNIWQLAVSSGGGGALVVTRSFRTSNPVFLSSI